MSSLYEAFRILRNTIRSIDPQSPKVYAIGDVDWWVAYSASEAIEDYTRVTGLSRAEALDDDSPEALPEKATPLDLERLVFFDDTDRRSFAEELDLRISHGEKFPQMFATSEY